MKAKDLDKIFDDGEVDINDFLDLSKSFKPGQEQKRVNVDFPVWMIDRLDREAGRLGVPRQSLIKVSIGEHLQRDTCKAKKAAESGRREALTPAPQTTGHTDPQPDGSSPPPLPL